jgi:hypothetical protein
MSTGNIPGGKGGRCMRVTTSPPLSAECHGNLGVWNSWNLLGHTEPVTGLLYLYHYPFGWRPVVAVRTTGCIVQSAFMDAVWFWGYRSPRPRSSFSRIVKKRRIAVNTWRSIEARSYNHCCFEKSTTYYIFWVCVCSLSYPACGGHAPYYIFTCGLPISTIFFPRCLVNGTIFGVELLKHKMSFDFVYKFCLIHFSF